MLASLVEHGEDLILPNSDPAVVISKGHRRFIVGLDIAQAVDRTAYCIIKDERIPFHDANGRQELGKRRREIVTAAQLPQMSYSDLAIVTRNLMMDPAIAGRAYLAVDSSGVGYDHDPTHRVKGYPSEPRSLLFDEAKRWPAIDAIANVPSATRRAAWFALLFTGLRMRNIEELEWSDIDLDQKVLSIGRMKNGQKRTFPLSHAVVTVFKHAPRTHDRIVFEGRHYGKPITGLRQIDLSGCDVKTVAA
ncbi:MAG: tyrosine-type recombinase/integrase [Cypionkella sp.]